jgi:serine/threonine protein kinase
MAQLDGNVDAAAEAEEAEELSMLLAPHEIKLERIIGEGTTAIVFLGSYDGEQVAVKDIRPTREGGIDGETMQAVQRELQVLSQVSHPNILRFIGIVEETTHLRMVLEYCSGGSLFELLHNRWKLPISWRNRFRVLIDTSSAQAYLHNFNPPILHRDLKSLNLLLKERIRDESDELIIKLADFGFARDLDDRSMTQCVGTEHWMAPEVINSSDYNQKADVFSFAMVTYEVCCRRVPFETLEPCAVTREILKGGRPDLNDTRLVPPEVPPRLLELTTRCWSQEPEDRPSFDEIQREMVELLEEFGGDLPRGSEH